MELHLFRIKVFSDYDRNVLGNPFSPSATLKAAVLEQPTSGKKRGIVWHIGNVQELDRAGLYFRIGRGASSRMPYLDSTTGDFVESEVETAPFTHALVDVGLEVCAIAPRAELAPNVDGVARRLVETLQRSRAAGAHRAKFSISALSNPDDFIGLLKSAFAIRSFSFTVQGRNPHDAHELFIKPFEDLVEKVHAEGGTVTVKGAGLNEERLEEITRSVAATGDDARARLVLSPNGKATGRKLRDLKVSIEAEALAEEADRREALRKVRQEYRRVRGSGNDAA